jgi:CDP-paratose 2-epimerase
MFEFWKAPRISEVYNLGGGKSNSCSVLEAFALSEAATGSAMKWTYSPENRIGDHICYYSDLRKIVAHYLGWSVARTLPVIVGEIADAWRRRGVENKTLPDHSAAGGTTQ